MQYKLLGYTLASFKGEDGRLVEGYNLYFFSPITENGFGAYSFRQFVLKTKCPDLKVGDIYDLSYRRGSGKLESISKI